MYVGWTAHCLGNDAYAYVTSARHGNPNIDDVLTHRRSTIIDHLVSQHKRTVPLRSMLTASLRNDGRACDQGTYILYQWKRFGFQGADIIPGGSFFGLTAGTLIDAQKYFSSSRTA